MPVLPLLALAVSGGVGYALGYHVAKRPILKMADDHLEHLQKLQKKSDQRLAELIDEENGKAATGTSATKKTPTKKATPKKKTKKTAKR